jgi:dienelactone hydrolase
MLRLLILLLMLVSELAFAQIHVEELATRAGVTIRFAYAKAENPVASAILFQGGNGNIGIFPNGSMRVENFLSGGAKRFTDNGITVAIVDVPSDRRTLEGFRNTAEHAQDTAAVIAFLRQQSNLPVWAIGTSNGSLSAATAAALLKEHGPDGIVLTSSVTRKPGVAAHPVTDAALDQIMVPTLFVHHKNDGCAITPYSAIPGVMESMKKAKKVDLITIEGGENRGNPCHTGYHQFLGIEAVVTKQIADWIKRYQSSAKADAGS